ncbi:MAG TPA: alpha/beta hydrolase [Chitinophagaceae bacterium]|jgi:pimeloyl-ACP methyl ester carboxylesterase
MQKERRKGRWARRLLRTLIGIILFFILSCFIFDHFVQFRKSDKELNKFFKDNNIPGKIGYYTALGRKLRYVSIGNDSLPTLLFIHGSPASMSLYGGRFRDPEILKTFHVLAIDRPGYGYSGFGKPEPSIQKQSEMISKLLDSVYKVKHPVIVVGGSFGAPIACRLTMDHPELVDGLEITGPAIGPGREKVFWFAPIIENPAIRWFIPRMFQSANTEKLHHKEELEKMLPYWKNIRVPVMYLQGAKDNLIDTSNASFARQQLVNAPYLDIYFFPNRHHFLAQYEWPTIKDRIMKLYQMAKNN